MYFVILKSMFHVCVYQLKICSNLYIQALLLFNYILQMWPHEVKKMKAICQIHSETLAEPRQSLFNAVNPELPF